MAQPETEAPESAPPVETETYGLSESQPLVGENPFAATTPIETEPVTSADSFTLPTPDDPSPIQTERDFGVRDYLWIIFTGYLIDPNNKAKVENMTPEQKSMLFRWRMVVAIAICALLALPFLYTRPHVLLVLLAVLALLFIFSHHIPTSIGILSSKQQSPPAPPDAPSVPTPPVDEIKKMKELFDLGAITQEEFDAFKKKTLGI